MRVNANADARNTTTIVASALPPIADMCGATSDVRFVPIADIAVGLRHVRFTAPKADIGWPLQWTSACPLSDGL